MDTLWKSLRVIQAINTNAQFTGALPAEPLIQLPAAFGFESLQNLTVIYANRKYTGPDFTTLPEKSLFSD